ncbi:MAG: N-acetyl-anhydromuranmyl-L-alanine amidase [Gammaproteobacteria bacterium RIFCSPHIGHO2_12_FULL_42_10]|nr:MAG: N-acetyl-anhydromuranmyl-L-alanine amidase [Gammaproteobacteria bacterium RIFCSPHIGHO2_12_FULL_42_10]
MATHFRVNLADGRLEGAIECLSPHCDDRLPGGVIDAIVIHGISLPPGEFGSDAIEHFFCGQPVTSMHLALSSLEGIRVSSHLLIKRTGEVMQFVPFMQRAWHAGVSSFMGRTNCNDFSIGIELEGTDDIAYEAIQYARLSKIILALIQAYPAITMDRIVGHSDIAPNRKTDPGPLFNWDYLRRLLV